jgi:hypothetical protein
VPKWLLKVWKYREALLHFVLGTLLNVYTIFYFKSGSFMSSIFFLLLLALLLFLNEARPARIPKHALRNALFGLCLISYMNIVVSIAVGSVGSMVFSLAICAASALHFLYTLLLRSRLPARRVLLEIKLPFVAIASVYVLLYAFKVLPPVPLSMKYMGIYRDVAKDNGDYRLAFHSTGWKFWERGEEIFEARPGDKVVCFVQVFSPTRFRDQLFVRWQLKGSKGWQSWDAIPIEITGGREEGFRGYTTKTNYQAGFWRVAVETADGREVGRIDFQIKDAAPDSAPPVLSYEYR